MADFGEAILGKHVPYVFDGSRIKAQVLAEKSAFHLARKKWKSAEKLALQGLRVNADSASALVAAGRCRLFIRRLDKARDYFTRALAINPRIHVQKELGWLSLEEGRLPIAISLLSDHLDRNASDFEAYNLLMKCFFLSERYEAGEDLGRIMMEEKVRNDCFRNNRWLCSLLTEQAAGEELSSPDQRQIVNPFVQYNRRVVEEQPSSWANNGRPSLREKLLFQEYRFGVTPKAGKENQISLRLPDDVHQQTAAPLITIGSLPSNDIMVCDSHVSRRHAVIVNLPGEVWLYDLGSTCGTRIGDDLVDGRTFLDGVQRITVGHSVIEVAAQADLLV